MSKEGTLTDLRFKMFILTHAGNRLKGTRGKVEKEADSSEDWGSNSSERSSLDYGSSSRPGEKWRDYSYNWKKQFCIAID